MCKYSVLLYIYCYYFAFCLPKMIRVAENECLCRKYLAMTLFMSIFFRVYWACRKCQLIFYITLYIYFSFFIIYISIKLTYFRHFRRKRNKVLKINKLQKKYCRKNDIKTILKCRKLKKRDLLASL